MVRLLDLFCGAGGASVGYRRAGFEVVGIDAEPMPNYPYEFIQADVFDSPMDFLIDFDAIHASPPCHDYSTSTGTDRRARGMKGTAWMLPAAREMLRATGRPYVIENVQGAAKHMIDPVRLCGSSFGMDIRRHRYFETNWPLTVPPCDHGWQTPRFTSLRWASRKAGKLSPVVGVHGHTQFPGDRQLREKAMGIDWMTLDELNESIPPRFTEHIGGQLMDHLS